MNALVLQAPENGERLPLGDVQQVHYHVVSPGAQIAMAGNLEHFDNAFEIISFIGTSSTLRYSRGVVG